MNSRKNVIASEKIQETLAGYYDRLARTYGATAQQLPEELMIRPVGHLPTPHLVRHIMYLCQKGSQLALEGELLEAARTVGIVQGYMTFADYMTVASLEEGPL